jgi:hypothetical protein
MINVTKYPYELIRIFLISLNLRREAEIPSPIEMPVSTEVKFVESSFPHLQVHMKISSPQDTPISFSFEIIGLFDYVGDKKEYDRELNNMFFSDKALHMLWVYGTQMIGIITGQMGMNPLQIKTPVEFLNPQGAIKNA